MTKTTTLDEIYAAINPLPAMLAAKGKVNPTVRFGIEANAALSLSITYRKPYAKNEWDTKYEYFTGDDFADALGQALTFINDLPSAEQAKLHDFMGKLGSIIDAARDDGIEVAYLNPLVETMKRLSENVITHQPEVDRLIAGLWDGEISEARFTDCAAHAGLTAPQIDAILREDSLS